MSRNKLAVVLLVLPLGCAGRSGQLMQRASERRVWPPPPAQARLELVGMIESDFGGIQGKAPLFARILWGNGPAPRMVTPHAIAVHKDGNRVAIADPNGRCVHLLDLHENGYVRIGSNGDRPVELETPIGVAWADDALCIADAGSSRVLVLDGSDERVIGTNKLQRPAGVAFDEREQVLFVSDAAAHEIVAYALEGSLLREFGSRGSSPGGLNFPAQIAVAPDGSVVVADALNFRVQRFSAQGDPLVWFGQKGDATGDFALPKGVAVDRRDRVWVVDAQFENVQAFDRDGRLLLAVGREGHAAGEFWLPAGAAIDEQDRLWIADTYNRRVQVFRILP